MPFQCKNCQATLTEAPEPDRHEWFILCLLCGAKNLITASLQIVGWHE